MISRSYFSFRFLKTFVDGQVPALFDFAQGAVWSSPRTLPSTPLRERLVIPANVP